MIIARPKLKKHSKVLITLNVALYSLIMLNEMCCTIDADTLIKKADLAMYEAKRAGGKGHKVYQIN